jgi:hypothetical protein
MPMVVIQLVPGCWIPVTRSQAIRFQHSCFVIRFSYPLPTPARHGSIRFVASKAQRTAIAFLAVLDLKLTYFMTVQILGSEVKNYKALKN